MTHAPSSIAIIDRKLQVGSRLLSCDEARSYALSLLMAVDALSTDLDLLKFVTAVPTSAPQTSVAMRERTVIGLLHEHGWTPLMTVADQPASEVAHYAQELARDARQAVIMHNESILTTETLIPPRKA